MPTPINASTSSQIPKAQSRAYGSSSHRPSFRHQLFRAFSLQDSPINPQKPTWARLFLPRETPPGTKPSILVCVHGGGFILCSAANPLYQNFCTDAASRLGALIVSIEYRLAPEQRLPAAYDDVLEVLTGFRDGGDEWVRKFGDVSRCVLMGKSAGGNIVYHAGLRAADLINYLKPLIIKGLVLIQHFLGGSDLTESELWLVDDLVLPLDANQLMWSLASPAGANMSHEYCDPHCGLRIGSGSGFGVAGRGDPVGC